MSRKSAPRPDPYLLEVPAWTGAAVETLRFSTHSLTTDPSDNPANTFYDGRIVDAGSFKRSIWDNGQTSGKANVDAGYVDLANDDGKLDPLINYGWNRIAAFKSLAAANAPVSGATTLMKPIVQGIETPDALHTLRLRFRGRMQELTLPLLTRRYLGTTTTVDAAVKTEGDEQLAGQIVPYAFGTNTSVAGKLINKFISLYQFAGNPQNAITAMDGGIVITSSGDYGDPASLINAPVPVDRCATCMAQGMVRYGSPPIFVPTANLVEGATAADRSAARIVQRLMALVATIAPSDVVTATFDALHAFNPAECCSYIDNDRAALDEISAVADSVGGAIIETTDGTYQAVFNAGPGTGSDATLTLRELLGDSAAMTLFAGPQSEGQGVPAYSVIINFGPIWRTMSGGDLAPRIANASTGDDIALKALIATATRQAVATDASVQTAYPQAVQLTFDTRLVFPADAAAEAIRRLGLYKERRDRVTFPTFYDTGNIELGRSIMIQLNRFGWILGKAFLITGREDDHKRRRRILSLWG